VTRLKGFDDAHGCAADGTDQPVGRRGVIGVVVGSWSGFDSEQCSGFGEVLSALAVGKEAVVPDAVKPWRQNVDEEAADELGGFEGHRLVAVLLLGPVVLPLKNDAVLIEADETRVGNRDTVGVAGEILQDGGGSCEGGSGIDVPVKVSKGRDELLEGARVMEVV